MIKTTTKKIEYKGETFLIDKRMPEDFAKALLKEGMPLTTNKKEEIAHFVKDTVQLIGLAVFCLCCFFLPSIIGGLF